MELFSKSSAPVQRKTLERILNSNSESGTQDWLGGQDATCDTHNDLIVHNWFAFTFTQHNMNVPKRNILRKLFERKEPSLFTQSGSTTFFRVARRGWGEVTYTFRNIMSTPTGPVIFSVNECGITHFLLTCPQPSQIILTKFVQVRARLIMKLNKRAQPLRLVIHTAPCHSSACHSSANHFSVANSSAVHFSAAHFSAAKCSRGPHND